MFSENFPLIRSKVVKTLSVLTKIDPNLITRDLVRECVTERFNDVAISVREEAVKLVGGFVQQGKTFTSHLKRN
jgi:HEAT repeat associated with sister chromatid cohesion